MCVCLWKWLLRPGSQDQENSKQRLTNMADGVRTDHMLAKVTSMCGMWSNASVRRSLWYIALLDGDPGGRAKLRETVIPVFKACCASESLWLLAGSPRLSAVA